MQIHQWLEAATQQLEKAGIGTARLDALVLLEDVMQKDRSWLLAHLEADISPAIDDQLAALLTRRAAHEPLAYIRKRTEFYGRDFLVTPAVLEPRPESETMIELLLSIAKNHPRLTIADIGTGSGALAITAKQELPSATVFGVDIDVGCLNIARQNTTAHQVDITFLKGDLLEPLLAHQLKDDPLVLLCNLPYVPNDYQINEAALQEPRLAIFGGPDGLDLYRKLFAQAILMAPKPAHILTESLPFQHHGVATLARALGYVQTERTDFIQLFEPL